MKKKPLYVILLLLLFVYNAKAQYWNEVAKAYPVPYLQNIPLQYFGSVIAMDSNYAVIGVPSYNNYVGAAYVLHYNGNAWLTVAKLSLSNKSKKIFFGTTVSISGNTVVVGARGDNDNGINSGSAYIFTKPASGWTDITETAKIKPSDGYLNNYFGYSVSISGDNIVVGAFNDYYSSVSSGAAYIYAKPANGWVNMLETAKIKPSDATVDDYFGYSVCISGNNIVVGATKDDDNGTNSGSAYVFTKPSNGWTNMTQTAKIIPSNGVSSGNFGQSVSISGDNIVIGADKYTNSASESCAYVFTKSSTGWTNSIETAIIKPIGVANFSFGRVVNISGDNIVVGAQTSNINGSVSGAAYIFTRPTSGWHNMIETARILPSDGAPSDQFGTSVCIFGDKILVGAPYNKDFGNGTGSIYSFSKPVTGWTDTIETQKLLPPPFNGNYENSYGRSVATDGDYTVVGAAGYDNSKGAAFVLYNDGFSLTTVAKLMASDATINDKFGYAVDISGDNIVVGAYQDGDNGANSGSAYVFTKPAAGWKDTIESAKILPSDGAAGDNFGKSVGISGDNIVVGSYYDDDQGTNSGSAYVFTRPQNGWKDTTETAKLMPSDSLPVSYFGYSTDISSDYLVVTTLASAYVFKKPLSGWANITQTAKLIPSGITEYFGNSVCMSENEIVVGAYGDSFIGYHTGAAYIFSNPATGWVDATETAKIIPGDGSGEDRFGFSVCISGNNIVVGTPYDDDNGSNSGSAYIFSKPSSGWISSTETAKILAYDGAIDDNFGASVSISGNKIVVGANNDDDYGTNSGSVYLFNDCYFSKTDTIVTCNNYTWIDGNTYTSSNYWATLPIINPTKCDTLYALNLTINKPDVTVTHTDSSITAVALGVLYQWLDCNNNYTAIPGAANQNFIPALNGNYAVELNKNGCIDTSACMSISLGISANNLTSNLKVFPNPASEKLNIQVDQLLINNNSSLEIINYQGKRVHLQSLFESETVVNISSLMNGLYMLRLKLTDRTETIKFIKE